jgi:hypothetical protein
MSWQTTALRTHRDSVVFRTHCNATAAMQARATFISHQLCPLGHTSQKSFAKLRQTHLGRFTRDFDLLAFLCPTVGWGSRRALVSNESQICWNACAVRACAAVHACIRAYPSARFRRRARSGGRPGAGNDHRSCRRPQPRPFHRRLLPHLCNHQSRGHASTSRPCCAPGARSIDRYIVRALLFNLL